MGHCFSSCLKMPATYKPANNRAFHNHHSNHRLSSPPTPIDVYNVIVEYDRTANHKSKSLAQRHTTGSFMEDNTSTQLSHTHSKTSLSATSLCDSNKKADDAPVDQDPILEMFEEYRDHDHPNLILAEGVERLCKHLNLQPQDRKVLSLAWRFKASTMCRFTREEFMGGCKSLQVLNIQELSSKLDEMQIEEGKEFKAMYKWCFHFGLDPPQRALPIDIALPLWSLILHHQPPSLLSPWLKFLEEQNAVTLISKDTWVLFLTLAETYHTADNLLAHYTDQEAWPSLIDDFVEYLRQRPSPSLPSLCCSAGCDGGIKNCDGGCRGSCDGGIKKDGGGFIKAGIKNADGGDRIDKNISGNNNLNNNNNKNSNNNKNNNDLNNRNEGDATNIFNASNSCNNFDHVKRANNGRRRHFKHSLSSSYCDRIKPCCTNKIISNMTIE